MEGGVVMGIEGMNMTTSDASCDYAMAQTSYTFQIWTFSAPASRATVCTEPYSGHFTVQRTP